MKRLFSPVNIAVATFFGTALAGSILLALNYRRAGKPRAAFYSVVFGAAIAFAVIAIALFTPDTRVVQTAFTALNIGLCLGLKRFCEIWQGADIAAHRAAGGTVGAGWPTAGIAVGCMVGVLAVLVAGLLVQWKVKAGDSVEFGDSTVYYKDGVTEAEAREVGETLEELGWFGGGNAMDIQVRRRGGEIHIAFIVDPAAAAELEDDFRVLADAVSEDVFGGDPVRIDFADDEFNVKKSVPP